MKLPNAEQAIIPESKIRDYLLSLMHRDGQSKARFFLRFGFVPDEWHVFASALRRHALTHDVLRVEDSRFGTRYVLEGPLETPDGRSPLIRVVWFLPEEDTIPRLATAYPT
jgi:hypothetical protein